MVSDAVSFLESILRLETVSGKTMMEATSTNFATTVETGF